jgi:hypothetical protein
MDAKIPQQSSPSLGALCGSIYERLLENGATNQEA